MRTIRTFRTKLLLLAALTSAIAVLLVYTIVMVDQIARQRQQIVAAVTTQAELTAIHSESPMHFDDREVASETLGSLAAVPEVAAAYLFNKDGDLFAAFEADRVVFSRPRMVEVGHRFERRMLCMSVPVMRREQTLGRLVIWYDMKPFYAELTEQALMAGAAGIGALVLALMLAWQLNKILSRPLSELAGVARSISQGRDYSLRAVKHSDDELGQLTDAFNDMLLQIEDRDSQIRSAHDDLEQRVRERTAELEVAWQKAEAANHAKSNFLANMSHEIRTPMTAILGYSELLQDARQSHEERLSCIQVIRRNGEHLLSIINDVLDISKIEAGKMLTEAVATPLVELIADVASIGRMRAGEKGLKFFVEYAGEIPEAIQTDPTRLRQILLNLVGNAVKFTQAGSVRMVIEMEQAEGAEPPWLRIDVIDTGIGMTQEQVGRLFRPFTQADETMTRRFGGTGLGLAISHHLAQMLGGDITVTSQLELGSRFRLTVGTGDLAGVTMLRDVKEAEAVPALAPSATNSGGAAMVSAGAGARILVAEDGLDNQRLIRHLLQTAGFVVSVAENGRLGSDMALGAAAEGKPFDLILMDMQMPEMDGYTATRRLRSAGYTGPIVALTAHAMAGDREKCLAAGCDDYLTKPINRVELFHLIERRLRGRQTAGAEAPAGAAATAAAPALVSTYADEPEMLELIQTFVAELPDRLDRMQQAMTEKDLAVLTTLAHQLKGAAAGYGYGPITDAARVLETAARQSVPYEQLLESLEELRNLVERAVACAEAAA